jgi:hypothetical protein
MDTARGRPRLVRRTPDAFLAARVHRRRSTVERDQAYLRSLVLPYFDGSVGRYTPADCRAWVTELVRAEYAPATVHKAAQLVRGIFEQAVDDRVLVRSPRSA